MIISWTFWLSWNRFKFFSQWAEWHSSNCLLTHNSWTFLVNFFHLIVKLNWTISMKFNLLYGSQNLNWKYYLNYFLDRYWNVKLMEILIYFGRGKESCKIQRHIICCVIFCFVLFCFFLPRNLLCSSQDSKSKIWCGVHIQVIIRVEIFEKYLVFEVFGSIIVDIISWSHSSFLIGSILVTLNLPLLWHLREFYFCPLEQELNGNYFC